MSDTEDQPTVNALHDSTPPVAIAKEVDEDYSSKSVDHVEGQSIVGKYTMQVKNFSFKPSKQVVRHALEYARTNLTHFRLNWLFPSLKEVGARELQDAPLHRINFSAISGELTAVIGDSRDRQELINLMAGRMNYGEFDGDILLNGPGISSNSYYYDKMAFVQRKPLYIPGITYYDMLHYAVQLKLQPKEGILMKDYINQRTEELIELMNLGACRDRVIPTYPELRGELGCDLRRLSIALEIVDLPPLIVVEEPTLSFDPAMSTAILNCLHNVASKGHIVLCSMTKPFFQEMVMLDRVVVLSDGYSIYSSAPSNIQSYFGSKEMGYLYRQGTDLVEFVLDIASGIERPTTQRTADLPYIMQEKFESSHLFETSLIADEATSCTAFSADFFKLWGYGRFDHWRFAGKRIITVIKRALFTKWKDWESNRKQIFLCTFIGLLCGYLQFQQGAYGNYCLSLFNVPYANTANVTSLMFFVAVISWTVPWLNGHVAIQKLQVYRYEQKSGVCTAFAFALATLLSEVPACIGVILIFLNIVYFMSGLGTGVDNYFYFIILGCMMSLCGLASTYFFSAICKKEIVLRDTFVVIITLVALMSGFPFQIPAMADYLVGLTKLNPARWAFEGLMNWKFSHYVDGTTWLKTYGQEAFDHNDIYYILGNIIWITAIMVIVVLQREPTLLRRKTAPSKGGAERTLSGASRDSTGSDIDVPVADIPRRNTRQSEAVQPVLFMRESSVTGRKSQLSVNLSQVGEDNTDRGPTVMFKDITYRLADPRHPTGYKTLLNRVSGQFDWGKLSMVMGGAGCGKTTLMHVLAGDTAVGADMHGEILFNNRPVHSDGSQPLWQRCGFVCAQNELHRDLSVRQVLTYAMKLRCVNAAGYSVVEENIKRTVEILQLEDALGKKAKRLNSGEMKRLSIAEEMVHGPKLLLVDEATTDISMVETAILLTCFREMVNQDRTVIVSVHQPTADAFKLFDTLLLLSKGRVIYHGNVNGAANYFVTSPYRFNMAGYNNPADFLADVSNSSITANNGDHIDASLLENYYMQGEFYNKLCLRFKPKNDDVDTFDNPMMKYGGAAGASNNSKYNRNSDMESGKNSIVSNNGEKGLSSFDIEGSDGTAMGGYRSQSPIILQGLSLFIQDSFGIPTLDSFVNALRLGWLLFERNVYALINRYELITASIFLHVLLACIFGWLMGNCSAVSALYNVTSLFAVGSLFLMFTNVMFAFYMFNNHKVFLKEHSRGLYSNTVKWLFSDYALYLLRMVNGVFFCLVAWGITDLDTSSDIFGFAVLSYLVFMTVCVTASEIVIHMASDLLSVYLMLSSLAFVNFTFSGLFLKFQSLPMWMAPWVPSLSMIRWNLQANFINVYENAFGSAPGGFSPYNLLLKLFGWGGKTKWFCLQSMVILACVYKGLSFFSGGIAAVLRKGGQRGARV